MLLCIGAMFYIMNNKLTCVEKQKAFNNINSKFNNLYDAVFYVGHTAHQYANKVHNAISHSEAINIVLLNKHNDPIEIQQVSKPKTSWVQHYIDAELSYINDDIVKNCATQSIVASLQKNYLIYLYRDGMTLEQMARVRVITNKLFDTIRTIQYND